ncbi:hypothetical protein WICPIJ_002895 [Wickerhamomyces pijperi]|uniref:AMP-activated protein kinase glycogen-binding domain-containing protein n=1 Tax=Wickerhamomyces pijperi TaxID=599730 RepID=A0A9P8TP82_WICPI|nr:hypothetical protein WICPIJ_002895 [Wickerhamomyces pijperi]
MFSIEWTESANNVLVTGTFDNWSQSIKITKSKGGTFSGSLEVDPSKKLVFKFVVDGKWLTSDRFRTERDSAGIENNVMYPDDFKKFNGRLVSTMSENLSSYEYEARNYDTESSAFTNISMGDVSHESDFQSGGIIDEEEEEDDDDDQDNGLEASTQCTISGDDSNKNLISLQEGNRQIKYFTSMNVLSRFTKLFN